LGRGAAALDPHHLDARVLREPEPPGRAARERAVLAGDAEVAAAHAADGHELPEDPLRGVDRDAEAQALGAQDHRRVDADHAPAGPPRSPRIPPTPASCASPSRRAALRASGRFWPAMPRWPRRTRPTVMSCPRTHFAVSIGTLKLRPWAPRIIAVLMPTTRPRLSTSGPPELPGLSATSLWMIHSIRRPEGAR